MPYYPYRYNRRRQYRRWRPRRRPRGGWRNVSLGQVWNQVKQIKNMINAEKKKVDTSITSTPTALSTTGVVTHLTSIGQGDLRSGRDGNSIYTDSIYLKGIFQNVTVAGTGKICIMIVQDTQQVEDNAAPSISNILQSVSVYSPLNADTNVGRFHVHCDKVVNFDTSDNVTLMFKFWKKIKFHVKYNGTAGSDIQKNGLYCVMISTNTSVNTPQPEFTARLSYYDN